MVIFASESIKNPTDPAGSGIKQKSNENRNFETDDERQDWRNCRNDR